MRISQATATLLLGALTALKVTACSAGGSGAMGQPLGGGGGGGAAGTDLILSGAGGDGILMVGDTGGVTNGGGAGSGDPGSCGIAQKPEQVLQYSPVALYLMQDISSSMVGTLGDPNSWPNSLKSVTTFVQDPTSAGLDVGLAVFPEGAAACDGSDCGKPVVEIGPLPKNAPAIVSGMQASTPPVCCNFTPTECALRGMINHCIDWTTKTGEQCVGILVTDGSPTTCDLNAGDLAQIVADGKAKGVKTFTLGLPGSDLNFLDQIAQAGGTTKSVDVSAGPAAFIAALNAIRGQVSVATALPCQWKIPAPPAGQTFNPGKVNVTFTPQGGAAQDFGYVAQADCARASDAWYFDDPNNPQQVLVCPTTCDKLKASSGAEVDVSFGCATKPAALR